MDRWMAGRGAPAETIERDSISSAASSTYAHTQARTLTRTHNHTITHANARTQSHAQTGTGRLPRPIRAICWEGRKEGLLQPPLYLNV